MGALGPRTVGGSPVGIHLYLADVDAAAARAVAGGAKLTRPVADQFYGDRLGTIEDPFGHIWHISTHIEDVSPEEIGRRAAAMAQGQKP
jgi:PhnB protein